MDTNIKHKVSLVLVLLAVCVAPPLYAADGDVFTVKTAESVVMTFKVISESNKTCQVGSGNNSCISISTRGMITIPISANGYTVMSIGDNAFFSCKDLTSIPLPNSVTTIGKYAFAYCSSLTSITLPSSVTSIGSSAFSSCSGLTSITIPNSVTTIGEYAFGYCLSLTGIVVEQGNTTYDSRENCNAIIKRASNELIAGCKNTIIPNSVTSIGSSAFYGCSGLTSIIIPNSVTSIDSFAFQSCSSLNSITIPNSVVSIGFNPFRNCNSMTSIVIEQGNTVYDSRGNCNAVIKTASNELVAGCKNTIIPNSVTSIDGFAFQQCLSLTNITIPNSVKSIDGRAFEGCTGLTSITLPNSVSSIGDFAFSSCSGLTSITIPNSVTSIGDFAFGGCSSLTGIVVEQGNRTYDSRENCNAIIETASNELIAGCKNTLIPNSVTSIGSGGFYDCSSLSSITIPNSVKSIGKNAFYFCSSLTSITLPNSVASIGSSAFENCLGLTSVVSERKEPAVIANDVFSTYNNHTLYVPYGTSEKYKAIVGWNTVSKIEEILMNDDVFTDFSQEGVEIIFKVISIEDKECQVGGDNEESAVVNKETQIITIPETVKGLKVTSVADNAFAECSSLIGVSFPSNIVNLSGLSLNDCCNLSCIRWNANAPFPVSVIEGLNSPNALLYVKSKDYVPEKMQHVNIVVNGVAENIVLKEASSGNIFYCMEEFTAKNIEFTHNYGMTSGYQTCQGWETIALPFDVTGITHESKMEMVPIKIWDDSSDKRPFWLYEQTAEGWKKATAIKANTPYIICMPNNAEQYDQIYCTTGNVTFKGTNVKVQASDNLKAETYNGRTFVPNFQHQNASNSIYALNVNNEWDKYEYTTYLQGSTFLPNLRAVHPFEAYMTTSDASASEFIPVFENGETTEISDALRLNNNEKIKSNQFYNLNGQRVEHLKKGFYITKGRKIVVR